MCIMNVFEYESLKAKEIEPATFRAGAISTVNNNIQTVNIQKGKKNNTQNNLQPNSKESSHLGKGALGLKTTSSVKIFGSGSNSNVNNPGEKKKEQIKISESSGSRQRDRINSTMLRQMIRETTPATEDNDLLHTELSNLGFSAFSDFKEPITVSKPIDSNLPKRSITPVKTLPASSSSKKSLNSSFTLSEANLPNNGPSGRSTLHSRPENPKEAKKQGANERSLTPKGKRPEEKSKIELFDSLNNNDRSFNNKSTSRPSSRERETSRISNRSPYRANHEEGKNNNKNFEGGRTESRVSTRSYTPTGKNVGGRVSELNLIKQKFKISEQFANILEAIKGDQLETVDLTSAGKLNF